MWRNANAGSAKPQSNKSASIFNSIWKATAKEIEIEDLSTKDVIVAVMGPTGTGRSTFIEIATGLGGKTGHTLESCTSDISIVKLSFPGLIDSDICFVDTPGFDDTRTSDSEVLGMISEWLINTYKREIKLSGLLYFHRISDNRMAGTPLKNLRMFENLCGKDFRRVVLTTTMWDEVETDVGERREEQLRSEYWKTMIERGSSVRRFHQNQKSAFDILAPIIDGVNSRSALLLQREVVDLGLQLNQTTMGRVLHSDIRELVSRYQNYMERVRNELKEPTLDPEQREVLMNDYKKVSEQLQRATEEVKKMKISVGDRIQRAAKSPDWLQIFNPYSFIGEAEQKKPSPHSLADDETNRYTVQEKGKAVERGDWVGAPSGALYSPPRRPGDGGGVAREWLQSDATFQRDREERESQERGKTVEREDWVGAASRAPYNASGQPGDEGGMTREWLQAEATFQRGREERESKEGELTHPKEWQRKQDLVRQQDAEARERESARQRERERMERERGQELAQAEIAQAERARRQEENWTRQERYRPEEEWTTGEKRARADEWPRRGSMAMQDEIDRGSAERARGRAERERARIERERAKERAELVRQ